ncbi:hypothetical protein SAMN05880590_102367 [Rhizobium sp. RU35A]|uniref:hypothetical protein n=1 Tax=Rhizobium sp. RU35A TaxID=1907414 RepID=UPI000953F21B|nr:hypothetical protein [Rhizobium sp. RU35A]SIQ16583.1 hypothetical protein SAMN05880590_102367 [Rhizobium sp. RU35A]
MVSSIDTVRLWSTQTAIRVFKETEQQDTEQQSLASTLLAHYGIDSSDDSSASTSTYSLADVLTGNTTDSSSETAPKTVSADIGSESFMQGLRDKLAELKNSPATRAQAESMLKALDAGKLTVTDAEGGKSVTAWDATSKDAKPNQPATATAAEWSGFLKAHLQRDGSGKYVRNDDGSYIDKANGASAYFGMIGDKYYYLSWSTAEAPATGATTA